MSKYRKLNRARRRNFAAPDQPIFANPASPSYAGELDGFITPALKSGDTLANNFINVLDGVQYKAVLQQTTIDDGILQAGGSEACGFVSGDSVTLSEQVLTLDEYKVNEQLCRALMVPSWVSASGTRHGDISSPEFKNYLLGVTAAKVAEGVENAIWKGSAIGVGLVGEDGTALTEAHFDASRLAGATTQVVDALTAGNVIDEMGKVFQKAATTKPAILSKSDTTMYVSNKTAALYRQALATAGGAIGQSSDGATPEVVTTTRGIGTGYNANVTNQALTGLNFLGIQIAECSGMYDDVIILAQRENLYLGTNLLTDLTEVKYVPVYEFDGSDNVRIVMRWGMGTQVGVAADVIVGALTGIVG